GSAWATWRVPMVPPAPPPRLSTITCWPSASASLSATIRAMMVLVPPAGNGTTRGNGPGGLVVGGGGGEEAADSERDHSEPAKRHTRPSVPLPPRAQRV